MGWKTTAALLALGTSLALTALPAQAQGEKKPNILVILGDDIGYWNISAYNRGMMGYRTPNIDRIAKEGAHLHRPLRPAVLHGRARRLHHRAEPVPHRPAQGRPARRQGGTLRRRTRRSPNCSSRRATPPASSARTTSATATSILPTVHGFDEFFGNLYHLNAEEEPENPDYPKDPAFSSRFGPRGVLNARRRDDDDPTEDPRFGRVGKQKIEDTGPLTTKRMETVDEEFLGAALDFIDRHHRAGQAVLRAGSTRPACTSGRTSSRSRRARPASASHADGMVEHDGMVGQLLKKLDDLGIADNTIVIYTTDNGAEASPGPTAAPRRSAARRTPTGKAATACPCLMRWPGVIKPGTEINDIVSHEDWLPTLVAAAGEPDVKREAADGLQGRRQDVQGPSRRLRPARPA